MIPSTHEVPPFPPLLSSLFGRVFLFGLGSITTGVSSFFFSLFYLIKLVQGIFGVGCGRKGLACFVYAGLQGGGGWFGLVYTWSTAAHVFSYSLPFLLLRLRRAFVSTQWEWGGRRERGAGKMEVQEGVILQAAQYPNYVGLSLGPFFSFFFFFFLTGVYIFKLRSSQRIASTY